jgi:hypothetical protein
MLSRLYNHITFALLIAVATSTFGAPSQFSFAAPTGWRLVAQPPPAKHGYIFINSRNSELRCLIGLGADSAPTVEAAQEAMLGRTRSLLVGPNAPIIRRSSFRAVSGLVIHKADVMFDVYQRPQLRRGSTLWLRCLYYSFQSPKDGRIYSFECSTEHSLFFDRPLDELAKSVSF